MKHDFLDEAPSCSSYNSAMNVLPVVRAFLIFSPDFSQVFRMVGGDVPAMFGSLRPPGPGSRPCW